MDNSQIIISTGSSGEEGDMKELFTHLESYNIIPYPNDTDKKFPYLVSHDPISTEDTHSVFDIKVINDRIAQLEERHRNPRKEELVCQYPRTQAECVPAPLNIIQVLNMHGIYKLPEMVYQTVGSIAYANGTKKDKMDAMRYALNNYIEDKHPGYRLHIFTEFSYSVAKEIHPYLEWGLYYTIVPNAVGEHTSVPLEDKISILIHGK